MVFAKLRDKRAAFRVTKNLALASAGLVPDDEVFLYDQTESYVATATSGIRAGSRGGVERLLAASRGGPDWERRWLHVCSVASLAAENPTWLNTWLNQYPHNPDALLLRGAMLIQLAWQRRDEQSATESSQQQLANFHTVLDEANSVLQQAAELNSADPTPWALLIAHAMGIGTDRTYFNQIWQEVTTRAPHHRWAHRSALQYWCQKWQGSHEEMFTFANQAANAAPAGSPLALLPVLAWEEYELAEENENDIWQQDKARAAVDHALTACPIDALANYDEPWEDRNLLAWILFRQDRYEEALGQFRAIGGYVTDSPWNRLGEDCVHEFLEVRNAATILAAAQMR